MKTRFNSFDIVCSVTELQRLIGMRVNNVYDVDNKTYLIRLQRSEEKSVLLFESGNRIHTTNFEWPKNIAPSGFSMKMRKHLKNKRLESLNQLGTDRIIDLQFGSGEAAYHIILELYDRGNIILTDHELTILNVLRPHTEGDKVKFAVREKYPTDRARKSEAINSEQIKSILGSAKQGDSLKKVLLPHLDYGPALIEHALLSKDFNSSVKIGKNFNIEEDFGRLMEAIQVAEEILTKAKTNPSKGYILQKKEERPKPDSTSETEYFYSNQEFNPFLFIQHSDQPYKEFETFNLAVDEFFSGLESQKIEMRALQQEREAMKKLENVRKDHSQRLMALERTQETDKQKAELITRNQELVDNAILAIHAALANQLSWPDIEKLVEEATNRGDPIASCIKKLKLEINTISLYLKDPYEESSSDGSEKDVEDEEKLQPMIVDINLDYTAFANARNYYDQKRSAAKKQQKTIESQSKALKSAEKKTKQTLKEVQTITSINKARKVYWFEKFFWFISSENYLVIAGRDQQQNELIVKRYMKPTDIYVHADIHGASSVVIKNPTGQPVPPKTLNEAGTMAICYSVAWEAKVVTNAYWVQGDQVSKTAPTGEYLTTGSFMIRGKKNFLPPCHLVLGLSFLFRLEDGCVEKHRGERKVIAAAEETAAAEDEEQKEEEEIDLEGGGSDVDEEKGGLGDIKEDEEEAEEFPDTHIKIDYSEGAKVNVVADSRLKIESDEESEKVVYLGDDKPVVIKTNQRSRGVSETSTKSKINEKIESKQEDSKHNQQQPKRGQKGKLKKMKEKYKDQDEEERKLRMDILQSAGSGKDTKKNKKNKDAQGNKGNKKTVFKLPKPQIQKPEEDEEEETLVQADTDMIDALTGIPAPEDELLFAVPVVAPYNTLANYKYKVKLTPGTGRRGKAAKTAVAIFIKDRSASQREKDLLKAVKDEQLARNIPGKVKLSAAKLHKK